MLAGTLPSTITVVPWFWLANIGTSLYSCGDWQICTFTMVVFDMYNATLVLKMVLYEKTKQ